MPDHELHRLGFYLVPEKQQNRVVQVVGLTEDHVSLMEAETRTRWTIARAPFEQRLRDGRVVAVEPRWEPAGERATV